MCRVFFMVCRSFFPTQVGDWSRRPISKALRLESLDLNFFSFHHFHISSHRERHCQTWRSEHTTLLWMLGCLWRQHCLAQKTQRYRVCFVPSFFLRSKSHLRSFFRKFPVIAGDEPDRDLKAVWNRRLLFNCLRQARGHREVAPREFDVHSRWKLAREQKRKEGEEE